MKKKLYQYYKKVRHNTRLLLESNEAINELRLNNKIKAINNKYKDCEIDNKKIVFSNYMGRGYGCNCKYLAEELIKQKKEYKLVWIINSNEDTTSFPKGIKLVDYTTDEAVYELLTAKYWITNYHLNYFIKKGLAKKDNQVYIQMWHGSFGIKKIERHAVANMESKMWLKVAMYNSRMTDYWISNSKFETEIYKSAFWDVDERNIIELGHPRNDIFYKDNMMLHNKVLSKYNIDSSKKIMLYMPTFREDYRIDCYNIEIDKLCDKLHDKFGGEWIVMVRFHPRIVTYRDKFFSVLAKDKVIDVTTYDDVQELLAVADVMISDYSSCIFDYLLSMKPGFIYATDIDDYENKRGFYYSLYETPFDICKNNKELLEAIDKFNEDKYLENVNTFLKSKGSVEDGNASEKLVAFLDEKA